MPRFALGGDRAKVGEIRRPEALPDSWNSTLPNDRNHATLPRHFSHSLLLPGSVPNLPRALRRSCAEGRNSRERSHVKSMYNRVITRTPVFSRGATVLYVMAQADELYFLRHSES